MTEHLLAGLLLGLVSPARRQAVQQMPTPEGKKAARRWGVKKQHPIRKMQKAEQDVWAGCGGGRASSLTDLNNQSIKVLARHVKLLLDALREESAALRAKVERLEGLIVALSEDERGLVSAEIHDEADRIRALRGGGK